MHIAGAVSAPCGSRRGPSSSPGELQAASALTTCVQSPGFAPEAHAVVSSSGKEATRTGVSAGTCWTLRWLELSEVSVRKNGGAAAWSGPRGRSARFDWCWLWVVFAFAGALIGIRLRRRSGFGDVRGTLRAAFDRRRFVRAVARRPLQAGETGKRASTAAFHRTPSAGFLTICRRSIAGLMRLKEYATLVAYKTLSAAGDGQGWERTMTIGWMTLAALAVGIGWLVAFTLMKVADDNDRAARHAERELVPFSDVTITRAGCRE